MQEALVVEHPEVAGTEVAVAKAPPVERRVLVIAAGDVALDQDLPDGAGQERGQALVVGDQDIDARQSPAHRVEPLLQRIVHVGDVGIAVGLGQPVDVAYLGHAEVDQALDLLRRAQRRAGAKRGDVARRPLGMLLQRVHHVGRAVEDGAALGLDQPERAARVEVLLQHDAARVGHHREERVLAAETPEERDREPEPVAGAQVQALADVPHVLDQGVVLQLHALGQCRGARGVEQVGDVLAAHGGLGAIDRRVVDGLRQVPQGLEAPRRVIGRAADAHDLLHARERIAFAP